MHPFHSVTPRIGRRQKMSASDLSVYTIKRFVQVAGLHFEVYSTSLLATALQKEKMLFYGKREIRR